MKLCMTFSKVPCSKRAGNHCPMLCQAIPYYVTRCHAASRYVTDQMVNTYVTDSPESRFWRGILVLGLESGTGAEPHSERRGNAEKEERKSDRPRQMPLLLRCRIPDNDDRWRQTTDLRRRETTLPGSPIRQPPNRIRQHTKRSRQAQAAEMFKETQTIRDFRRKKQENLQPSLSKYGFLTKSGNSI